MKENYMWWLMIIVLLVGLPRETGALTTAVYDNAEEVL
jgi:hypothetical protein